MSFTTEFREHFFFLEETVTSSRKGCGVSSIMSQNWNFFNMFPIFLRIADLVINVSPRLLVPGRPRGGARVATGLLLFALHRPAYGRP